MKVYAFIHENGKFFRRVDGDGITYKFVTNIKEAELFQEEDFQAMLDYLEKNNYLLVDWENCKEIKIIGYQEVECKVTDKQLF